QAPSALKAGAWQDINNRAEPLDERLNELPGDKQERGVDDSVGRYACERGRDCGHRWGVMVSWVNSSGSVAGVNLVLLN
ncbi:quinone oxidoreductase, partial [Escherichia coli]